MIGWINWFVVALIGLALWEVFESSDSFPWIFLMAFAGIAGGIYAVQVYRFRKVAAVVAGLKTLR